MPRRRRQLKLDRTDARLLNFLMNNAKAKLKEIADALGVATGTVYSRLRNKLEPQGVIKGARLLVDRHKIGLEVEAIVLVRVSRGANVERAIKEIEKIPQVTTLYSVTGDTDFILHVVCKDIATLQEILMKKLSNLEGIQQTTTYMVLETPIDRGIHIPEP